MIKTGHRPAAKKAKAVEKVGRLRGRLSGKDFSTADSDKDGTISAVVEQRFKAADTDNDGTLTLKN